MLAHRIAERGSSSSGAWATPTRRDEKGPCPNKRKGGRDLPTDVLWATPIASDASRSGSRRKRWDSKAHPGLTLTDQTVREYPTPTASTYGSTNNGKPRDGKREEYATKGTPSLDSLAVREWGGQLNADWVETLMGLPVGWTRVGPPAEEKRKPRLNRRALRQRAITTAEQDSVRSETALSLPAAKPSEK